METINKMTAAAANAVWGTGSDKTTDTKTTSGEKVEPLSGVTGDTAKGEPYDAGNITPAPTSAGITFPVSPIQNEKPTETGPEAIVSPKETDLSSKETDLPSKETDLPSKDDVSSPTTQLQKLQLGHEEPSPLNEEPQSQHEESEPRPIEPASKEEGDVKGGPKTGIDTTVPQPTPDVVGSAEQKSAQEPTPEEPNTEEHSTKEHSTEDPSTEDSGTEAKGTGEEYVKSTGVQADGGDFDATKPGAGFEADRLLEEKGGREGSEDGNDPGHKNKAKSHASKRSLGERIKAKLHKDKH